MTSNSENPNTKLPPEMAGSYPPPSNTDMQGFPAGGRPYRQPKSSRTMDRMVGTLLTILGVVAAFLFLVMLLSNIAPNSPTNLVPNVRDGAQEDDQQQIIGD